MTPAEKYGRGVPAISAESLQRVQSAGQTLAANNVVHQQSLGNVSPAHTPSMKFGSSTASRQPELPPPTRTR